MIPKKNKNNVTCSCGYVHKESVSLSVSEKIDEQKEIEVMNMQDKIDTLPVTEVECPKCGHDKARFWMMQTRSADEAETRFFRCEKCKHVWRDAA